MSLTNSALEGGNQFDNSFFGQEEGTAKPLNETHQSNVVVRGAGNTLVPCGHTFLF